MRMKTAAVFRPLQTVPDRYKKRRSSQFSAGWMTTLQELDRELQHLGAEACIIQIDTDESQIRQDGWPRADARVLSPAVAVAFESRRGYLTYPCDTFTTWQDNIRAIAKGLEALRAVDRYGITSNGEQYRGWKALTYRQVEFTTAKEAAVYLASLACVTHPAGEILASEATFRAAVQQALSLHPDRGGDASEFQRVLAAKETLSAAFRRRLES